MIEFLEWTFSDYTHTAMTAVLGLFILALTATFKPVMINPINTVAPIEGNNGNTKEK